MFYGSRRTVVCVDCRVVRKVHNVGLSSSRQGQFVYSCCCLLFVYSKTLLRPFVGDTVHCNAGLIWSHIWSNVGFIWFRKTFQ